MPHCENIYKEAQSSEDNLWIFKFGFISYLKIIQIFLTKLIRATLTKALLKYSRFCLMEDVSYFFQSSWASFWPGALLAESSDQHSLIVRLVVAVVEKGFWWRSCHLNVVGATLTTAWGKKEGKSLLKKVFLRYFMYFCWAEGLSSFSEAALKRLPTATEAEVKQVISAQLKYSPDRAHGGGRGNDGRVTERSWNGSGTSNPQLWDNFYCIYLGLSDKTTYNFLWNVLFTLHTWSMQRK